MAKYGKAVLFFLFVSLCSTLIGAADERSPVFYRNRRDASQVNTKRAQRARCVSCSVNGQLYDGHSRFQYEEGCNRYRCVCRCDGSWDCPAKYTENICENAASAQKESHVRASSSSHESSSSSSSAAAAVSTPQRSDGRCRSCMVNGKEQKGHSYFTHVDGCITIDNCICHCNGSWVCPPEKSRNTCADSQVGSSSGVSKTAIRTVETEKAESGSSSSSSSSGGSSFISSSSSSSGSSVSSSSGRSSTGCSSCSSSSDSGSSSSNSGSSRGSSSVDVIARDRRRNGDQRHAYGVCQNCTVSGKVYAGNSYFELDEGCRKMKRCSCYCNGSWNCPDRFVENTCGSNIATSSTEQKSGCKSCSVKGQTFPGNQNFQVTDGCIEYKNCICNCDGSWNCPDTGAKNICSQAVSTSGSGCRQCQVKGKTFPGNQYFQVTDGCIEYKNCICNCDGSWNCPDTGAKNICDKSRPSNTDATLGSGCRQCQVKGQTFPGNQNFQITDGCIEYKNCICNCDGSWNCPDTGAKNICKQGGTSNTNAASGSSCRQCQVKGQTFPGNQNFQVTDGCIEYKNCICNCDGSWNCPDTGAKNICDKSRPPNTDATLGSGCRQCQVKGQTFPGNQNFQITDGCIEYKNCICNCDGSWNCPDTGAKNICDKSRPPNTDATLGSGCRQCQVKGQTFPGNQYFQVTDGCIEYKNCICNCDGSWNCPDTGAKNICSQAVSTSGSSCRQCQVKGQTFPGNQYFQVTDGCIEYKNCICNCDGSWNCPDTGAKNICNQGGTSNTNAASGSSCRQCQVKGQTFPGNQNFQVTDGCIEYKNCICNCDGSWNCPDTGAKNICDKSRPPNTNAASGSSCRQCQVKGQIFPGNQNFQMTDGCIEYKNCICNCDGSWNCPDTGAKNICSQAVSTSGSSCRQCQVKGQTFPGNQYFQVTDGCIEYKNCICNCDGSWNCPDTGAKNICNQGGTSNTNAASGSSCRQCQVKGQIFPGNQNFQMTDGCIEYKNCICNCDGSWNCPDTGAKNICSQAVSTSGSSCRQCQVKGQTFPGNQYFQVTDGCIEYKNCICNCDGSWNCPDTGAKNICNQGGTSNTNAASSSSCRQCQVKGQIFPGNQNFQMTDGCIEYKNCICNCDGSWNCPDTGAKNICERGGSSNVDAAPGSGCRQCQVKGQIFPGNQYFEMTDGCIEYRNCVCRCDGSWSCPDNGARNKCQEKSEKVVNISACTTCTVYGSTFPGNQYFQVKQGCIEYRNCICHCNGTWQCPGDSAVNTCDSKPKPTSTVDVGDASRTSVSGCQTCSAYGQNFKGGDYFDVVDGCTSYRNCVCRCNGSWYCNSRFASNICKNEPRVDVDNRDSRVDTTNYRNTSRQALSTDNQCAVCNAKNKVVKGNSYFEITEGCVEYKQCLCKCDGSWECPSQFAKNICIDNNKNSISTGLSPTTCSNCVAKGKIVTGNTYFELIDGCTRYRSCRCNCDGKWECPEQRTQNICFTNTTVSDSGCSLCQSSDGTVHQPSSRFKLTENCIEYNCNCFCNGSWSCPGNSSRWICQDRCLQCDVNGRKVQNNTQFVHKTGCLEYTCNCHCNGSWSCPGNTVKNTCAAGVRDGCNKCRVSSTEVFEGESDFVLKQECLHYKCRCNCDGSYSCPGKEARNVCRGEVLGGCKSCLVSETEIHKGETDFTMRKDCINYECRCNCDGSYECPAEKARNICLGESPGGCRACRVSETEVYRADSTFDMRKDCIHYKCKCNCDGSWNCPGEDARDVCKGEIPGGCKSCVVGEEFYPGSSNFEMVKNCIHYKCRCNCDGGYSCPGQTARRVCQAGAATTEVAACKSCKLSETEQFAGNTTFNLERGCARYECECRCDGSWLCPPGKTRDICARDVVRPTSPTRCKTCKISKEVYPGNTSFKFTRGCSQFDCKCDCSGRFTCDHKNRVNVCRTGEQTTERPLISDSGVARTRQDFTASGSNHIASQSSQKGNGFVETDIQSHEVYNSQDQYATRTIRNSSVSIVNTGGNIDTSCRPCSADGRIIQPNVVFSIDRGCLQYRNCKCYCDGRWECSEESNRCGTTQIPILPQGERSHRTDTQSSSSSSSRRHEVDSSAWVYVDGVDSSFKTRDDHTGGGYVVQVDTKYAPMYSTGGQDRRRLEQLESRPSSSGTFVASGSSSSSSTFMTSGISPDTSLTSSSAGSTSHESKGTNQCLRCQVDTKTYPSGANFDMRRGCVVYKCLCLCSGSYRCRLTSDNECSVQDKHKTCSNCLYQGMVFPGSMGFTVREGCEEKQCNCNCDGTHVCHSSKPITGCTDAASYNPALTGYGNFYPIPGGLHPASTGYVTNTGRAVYKSACTTCVDSGSVPVVYHAPVHPAFGEGGGGFISTDNRFKVDQGVPRDTCSGCIIDGQIRNGNSTFTFEKDCIEFDCYCACGGSWKCAGRLSIGCTPGFAPDTVPHTTGCRNCLVQGTSYPANARFSLRQGCHEYQCSCNCDGGWSCPAQHPVNLCPQTPTRPVRGHVMDPQIVREETYVADQGISNGEEVKIGELKQAVPHEDGSSSKGLKAAVDTCYECEVRGVSYQARSKFFLRDGCIQRICECHCNRSWSCSENTVDICQISASEADNVNSGKCRDCQIGSDVYVSENDFQINNGCFQRNCYCYCNGTYDCPKERIRDICNLETARVKQGNSNDIDTRLRARLQQSFLTAETEDGITAGKVPGCKDCYVDGEKIEALSTFVKQLGCYESLCNCQCNGNASCPPSASVNVCELPDKLPMNERKGCQVGRRTHRTRVFAHIENCIQRTCVCHDNGEWSCKKSANDIKVC